MEDSLFTGLQARDLAGRITYVNPAFCRMTGFTAGELLGCAPPMPYWTPEHRQDPREPRGGPGTPAGADHGYETEFVRRSGERFPALVFEAPLIDEHGRQSGWMGSILDLGEQKRIEELNRRQQEKLQANSRMALLGEVASALSHELNQPLAAITSYASACENLLRAGEGAARGGPAPAGTAAPGIGDALARIRTQSERAGLVIRSVQDFIRRRRVDCEVVSLEDLLSSVEPLIRLQAVKAGGRLAWRADPAAIVLADRTMLEQVLLNMTRNAFEAMEEAPAPRRLLEIDAEAREEAGRAFVSVELRDRGAGVPPALEAQLFTAFFTTKTDGLGIGLSLCRSVIEAHGGRLEYRARAGGGAVFRFELPAARRAGAARPPGHTHSIEVAA
jgi:two-component system sensor histidine kinase DctS